jgi:ubiquinone/menaquinone biosynthesis C-methylase UbiE
VEGIVTVTTYGKGFAEVYDQAGFSAFSERMIPYIDQSLERLHFAPRNVLDLACGTGAVAISLAKRGWKVYGVDGSPHMLEVAKNKVSEAKVSVEFLLSDMRKFSLPEKVDLTVSLYDSLNYITNPKELVRVFARVKANLNQNGFFMFDMNTLYCLKYRWDNSFRTFWITDDIFVVENNLHDPKKKMTTKRFNFFMRRRQEIFERILEEHAQRGYTVNEIRAALVDAGLAPVDFYDCFTFNEPGPKATRIFCISKNTR